MALLIGEVVSGVGNFSYWIEKLQDHYFRKTGMHLFPGTLNVQLEPSLRDSEDICRGYPGTDVPGYPMPSLRD